MPGKMVFAKIREYLVKEMDLDDEELRPENRLIQDLGLSSLEILNLIAETEKNFSVKISEKMIRTFVTVQDVVDCAVAAMEKEK